MPKKKTRKPVEQRGAKTAFVLTLPHSMPAKDVVAKAKARGLSVTTKHVYVIRSEAKKKKGKASKHSSAASAQHAALSQGGGGSAAANFRKLVLALGVPKARALLADVERRLNALLAGH